MIWIIDGLLPLNLENVFWMIYDKYKWLIKEIVCNTDLDM